MSRAFGEHLRNLRKKHSNYTQQDMADMLKISRSTYTYYETGKSEPGQDTLSKICEILEVDYNTLLGIQEDRKNIYVASGIIKDGITNLSPEEEQIILAYRRMGPDDKDIFNRQVINIVKNLNKEDQ